MSGEGLNPLKRYVVKGIAGGIGLASESISSYKARNKAAPNDGSSNAEPTEKREVNLEIAELSSYEEAVWELDDAQTEVVSSEHGQQADTDPRSTQSKHQFKDLKSFLIQYPPPPYPPSSQLALPVILPQRRPKNRQRGFVQAYAPVLNDCAISQDMFLDLLETFYISSQASPWIAAINLAGLGLSFVPHVSMLVGLAIQAGVMVAQDVQNRTRTNSFLDHANAEVFRPRGLFCLVMAFDPTAAEKNNGAQLNSTIANRLQPSGFDRVGNKLKESSGTTVSEMDFPESAPLIFPGLDDIDDREGQEGASTKEKLSKKKKYVQDYYDKRARAKFARKHPDSVLNQGPQPTFTSRYADPNHPAASGSFRSLITGGFIKPPSMTLPQGGLIGRNLGQGRQGSLAGLQGLAGRPGLAGRSGGGLRDQIMNARGGGFFSAPMPAAPYGGSSSQNAPQDPNSPAMHSQVGLLGLPSAGAMIKKAVKSNVLYLMIVNMPSEEELAEAMADIEARRKQGFRLPSVLGRL
ncbi:hypothetical protein B0T10DRAFT_518246 [Thelonectria olida]|uniref:Uncharacterized protein n=1 Tax=Thelonectria olida TaxID=1576542 RepID=A0A9P8VX82_9HYPO|nr:hypothetical protein B0T10DRAFT_518246 [Thelonectria olida]